MCDKITFVLILFLIIHYAESAKILVVFNMAAKSHYILGSALSKELADRGHDVTMISPFGENNFKPKNGTYRDIVLTGMLSVFDNPDIDILEVVNSHVVGSAFFLHQFGSDITNQTLAHPNVQKLLKSNEKFDVVIIEQFLNDALKYFAHHFDAQLIVFSTVGSNAWVNHLVGNPEPPASVSDMLLAMSNEMTFFERVKNAYMYTFAKLLDYYLTLPLQNKILLNYFPNAPDLSDIIYNASLILLNSHSSIKQPTPLVPSMIEIGGYHVKPPKKLPKDLQEYLDNAKDGVIYFSMGSNFLSTNFPIKMREALIKVFARLKMSVLWKWENDTLLNKPENVKIYKWVPQQEVLAHPNVKLFITHGGLLSTIEAIHCGVPILAIPLFGDQALNAKQAVNNGYCYSIPFQKLNEESLERGINEMLSNTMYRDNVQVRSSLLRDRQNTPMEIAMYWIEYVVRNKGAHHLKVASLKLNWYQNVLLDVILFTLTVFLIIVLILVKCVALLFCSKSSKKASKRKTQ